MYALIRNGEIAAVRNPGRWEIKISDGAELSPPRTGWTDELAALCGFVPIVQTTRPTPPEGRTVDYTVQMVEGQPTVVWVERDLTAAEQQAAAEQANASTIDVAITAALTRLQELVDAPAVDVPPSGTMTTAQLSNVVRAMRDAVQANRAGAQEVALTLKRTIRLVRGDFDAVD